MNNILTTHKQPKVKLLTFSIACFIILFITLYSLNSAAGNSNVQTLKNPKQHEKKLKVLIVISSDKHGYWLPEVLEPYQLLQQAGFEIDIASPLGGKGKASGSFRLSLEQEKWFEQSDLPAQLSNSLMIGQVNANNYQAIYFAGGSGPMFDFIDKSIDSLIKGTH